MTRSRQIPLALSLVLAAALAPAPAQAIVTPLSEDVFDSIERGVQYLRDTEGGDGYWTDWGANCLCGLAVLEQRTGPDTNASFAGYEGLDDGDRAIVRRVMRDAINRDPSGRFNAYQTGSFMMFASVFRSTGGPDDVDADNTVIGELQQSVTAAKNAQMNGGAWCYSNAG